MTDTGGPRTLQVAGWDVSLIELDVLHAPLGWVLPDAPEDERAWLPCNVLLMRREQEVMLVDCGLGVFHDAFDMPVRLVPLADGLAAVDSSVDEITTVVLTHLDPDHAGGIVIGTYPDDLGPALPAARVAVLDLVLRKRADLGEHAAHVVTALLDAGVRVEAIADASEIVPGVRFRSAPGHRLGHTCVEVADARERFVFLADVVHAKEHVAHPEWDRMHDTDPLLALATRRAFLADLAGSGAVVACSHVATFGRISDGRTWVDVV